MEIYEKKLFFHLLENLLKQNKKSFSTTQYQVVYSIAKMFVENGEEINPGVFQMQITNKIISKELDYSLTWINAIVKSLQDCRLIEKEGLLHSKKIMFRFNFNRLEGK